MTKPKILVVDDEQSNVDLLETYLSPDYDVVTAFNGKEALVKVEKTSPDLILLDIVMPGMSGFEVCRKLKSNEKTFAKAIDEFNYVNITLPIQNMEKKDNKKR